MIVLGYVFYFIKFLFLIITGPLFFIVALLIRVFDLWLSIEVFRMYIRLFFYLVSVKIQYSFKNPETVHAKSTVFVLLNQFSFLDSLLMALFPVKNSRGILNIEFAFYPVTGWFMAIANFVIVRQWRSQAKRVMNRTNKFIRGGGNMVISIEGKRTHNGKLNPYKKGPVVLAINNQADIVPMIIRGTYELLPYRSLVVKPGTVSIEFLDPIPTKGHSYMDRDALVEKLRNIAHDNGLE